MFSQQPNGGRLEQNPIWVLFIEGFFLMVVSHFQLLTHPQHQSKTKVVIAFSQKINRARSVSRVSFNRFFFLPNSCCSYLAYIIFPHFTFSSRQPNILFFLLFLIINVFIFYLAGESMHLYQEETFCPFKKRTNAKPETPSTIAGDATPIGLTTANV
jgi:hypothetical protein